MARNCHLKPIPIDASPTKEGLAIPPFQSRNKPISLTKDL